MKGDEASAGCRSRRWSGRSHNSSLPRGVLVEPRPHSALRAIVQFVSTGEPLVALNPPVEQAISEYRMDGDVPVHSTAAKSFVSSRPPYLMMQCSKTLSGAVQRKPSPVPTGRLSRLAVAVRITGHGVIVKRGENYRAVRGSHSQEGSLHNQAAVQIVMPRFFQLHHHTGISVIV